MKKVLLASSSKVFLKRNTSLLMGRGFHLFTATTGAEALSLNKENVFDLILADYKLDDMCGCTLCSLLRKEENSRLIPVILICHNLEGSKERIEESCASAMLVKPIDPLQLLETVGSYLDLPLGRSKRSVLRVKVMSRYSELEFLCFSHDISNSGILLETDYQLALGCQIVCQFSLPGSCQIETEGEVIRWMNASEHENFYGIRFTPLTLSSRMAIDSYINSLSI